MDHMFYVKFKVLTMVLSKTQVLWEVALCL